MDPDATEEKQISLELRNLMNEYNLGHCREEFAKLGLFGLPDLLSIKDDKVLEDVRFGPIQRRAFWKIMKDDRVTMSRPNVEGLSPRTSGTVTPSDAEGMTSSGSVTPAGSSSGSVFSESLAARIEQFKEDTLSRQGRVFATHIPNGIIMNMDDENSSEDLAATRIQAMIRVFLARRLLCKKREEKKKDNEVAEAFSLHPEKVLVAGPYPGDIAGELVQAFAASSEINLSRPIKCEDLVDIEKRGWTVISTPDHSAAICYLEEEHPQKTGLSIRLVEDPRELSQCIGQITQTSSASTRLYKLEPAGPLESPVWVGIAKNASACGNCDNGNNEGARILRKSRLDDTWEVLESFSCRGWVWAKMTHFCWAKVEGCYPYASCAVELANGGIHVTLKLHSAKESCVGLPREVEGPLSLRLEDGQQYDVVLEANGATTRGGFTWRHGDEALCTHAIRCASTVGDFVTVSIGSQQILTRLVRDMLPSQHTAPRRLQNSFVTEGGFVLEPYRNAVERVPGWKMCPLIANGVKDSTWLPRWQADLDTAHGVIIIFNSAYKKKCEEDSTTPVLREARRIMNRMGEDPTFRVFALDPEKPGQDCNSLGFFLFSNEFEMNKQLWLNFVKEKMDLWLRFTSY